MKKNKINILIILHFMVLLSCSSTNRLKEYDFQNDTLAVRISAPPRPEIFTEPFWGIHGDNIIETAINVGTSIAKGVQISKAQARLDSAVKLIDLPRQIKNRTLETSTQILDLREIKDYRSSAFGFNIFIKEYGIEANSWSSSVYFKIDLKATLLDQKKDVEIWKKGIEEKQPVNRGMFGLGDAAGDVITAVTLAKLSVEEIADGLQSLADYTSDQIIEKLCKDYSKSRMEE